MELIFETEKTTDPFTLYIFIIIVTMSTMCQAVC